MKPMQPVRGTADLMPRQKSQMNIVLEKASLIASRYGFQDMETPIFEFTEVFSRPLEKALTLLLKKHIALKIEGARA